MVVLCKFLLLKKDRKRVLGKIQKKSAKRLQKGFKKVRKRIAKRLEKGVKKDCRRYPRRDGKGCQEQYHKKMQT